MKSIYLNFKINNFKKSCLNFFKNFYVLIILGIIYIPLIVIILLSFNGQTSRGNIIINFDNKFSFSNYFLLFKNNSFVNGLYNSFLISLIVVPISTTIAVFTCLGIWSLKNKLSKTIIAINEFGLSIPDPIIGVGLAILFVSTLIPLGFDFGFFTICLAHISYCTPYAIIFVYPKVAKLNKDLILASYDLGYSKIQTFFHIIFPYLVPTIFLAMIIVFSLSFDDFVITNFVNGSFSTLSTSIYATRNGIKAWVVTFGALIVICCILASIFIILIKIKKVNKKIKLKIKKDLWN